MICFLYQFLIISLLQNDSSGLESEAETCCRVIPVHVGTVPPANLWPHKLPEIEQKSWAGSSAGAFTFTAEDPSNPPTCDGALWAHVWPAEAFEMKIHSVSPFFPSSDFEDLFDDDDIQWLMWLRRADGRSSRRSSHPRPRLLRGEQTNHPPV